MTLLAAATSVIDDASGVLNGPLGVGVFLITMLKIIVSVMGDRAKACETDRSRCYERLDLKDKIQAEQTEEIRKLNADEHKSDEDVRRYLDERFADVKTAIIDIRAELRQGRG